MLRGAPPATLQSPAEQVGSLSLLAAVPARFRANPPEMSRKVVATGTRLQCTYIEHTIETRKNGFCASPVWGALFGRQSRFLPLTLPNKHRTSPGRLRLGRVRSADALPAKPASHCDRRGNGEKGQRPRLRGCARSVDGDIIQAVGVVAPRIPIEKVDGSRRC